MNPSDEQRRHERLCAYLFGELQADERVEVERWLAESPELRAEKTRLEATIGLVQSTLGASQEADVLSAGARAELSAAAQARAAEAGGLRDVTLTPAPPARRWFQRPVLHLAAAASLLALLYVGYRTGGPGDIGEAGPAELVAKNEAAQEGGRFEAEGEAAGLAPRDADASRRNEGPFMKGSVASEGERLAGAPSVVKEQPEESRRSLADLGYVSDEALAFDDARQGLELAEHVASAPAETPAEAARARALGEDREKKVDADGADAWVALAAAGEREERDALAQAGQPLAPLADAEPELAPVLQEEAAEPADQLAAGRYVGPGDTTTPEASAAARAVPTGGKGGPAAPGPAAPSRVAATSGVAQDAPALPAGRSSTAVQTPGGAGALDGRAVDELLARAQAPAAGGAELGANDFFLGGGESAGRGDAQLGLRALPPLPWEQQVELLLDHCRQAPGETPSAMFFRFWGDNPFELTALDPLSTFAVDVDTSSYALARRTVQEGRLPGKDQIRTEEFVNYFEPDVPAPAEETFAIELECAPSRFGGEPGRSMLRVVVRGKEVPKEVRKPVALTFVVDVSGSMARGERLELVKHALRLLVAELDTRDSISLVAFSNEARLVLPPTSADKRGLIEAAIFGLSPQGGTNAEAGLKLGYEQALLARDPQAENRVVLLSDGVANVGETDQKRLTADVAGHRKAGIYLNTVGVGMGNHNDVFLEQLANEGDGVSCYVDSPAEARRALVDGFTGAFQTIARDVKVQVEFDPRQVASYRQLGYENRAIADADFRDDAVDAGEVGAGHQVTALYELERLTAREPGVLATVRLRYKAPHDERLEDALPEQAMEIEARIRTTEESGSFSGTTFGYRRSVVVAQYAELLRRSVHAKDDSFDELIAEAEKLAAERPDPEWLELVALMRRSRELVLSEWNRDDPLLQTVDAVRRNNYLQAQARTLQRASDLQRLEELEAENRALEAEIRELLRRQVEAREVEARQDRR